jgi:hypothetical protein
MATITITPGNSFTATEAVTSTKLNDLGSPTAALTAASIGTDDIADNAITPVKLSAGGPSWGANGNLLVATVVAPEFADSLTLRADPESPDPTNGGAQISLHSSDSSVPNQIYNKSAFTYFQNMSGATVASIGSAGPTAAKDLATKEYVDDGGGFTPSTYAGEESVTLPNNLIMKFGSQSVPGDSTATVSFATDFPSGIVQVQLTIKTTISLGSDAGLSATSQTVSGFTIQNGASSTETISWMAIGY